MNKSMTTWNLQRNSKGKITESISVDPFLASTQKPHKLVNTDLSFIESTQESIMQGGRKNRPEALGLFTSRNIGSPFNSSGDLLNNTKEYSKTDMRATNLSMLLKASPVKLTLMNVIQIHVVMDNVWIKLMIPNNSLRYILRQNSPISFNFNQFQRINS